VDIIPRTTAEDAEDAERDKEKEKISLILLIDFLSSLLPSLRPLRWKFE